MVTTLRDMKFRIEEVAGRMPERVRWELIEGELHMMSPSGWQHGKVTARITALLDQWARERRSGVVYAAETGFILSRNPDTLRAPDVAFVRAERGEPVDAAFFDGAPDLAVEVISPSESTPEVMDKARQWLEGGAQAVWLVWPRERRVNVLTKDQKPVELNESDAIIGEPVLPGFSCPAREIFD